MNALSLPVDARLALVTAPGAARAQLLQMTARLALTGPLRVLDGGNSFDAYAVARAVRTHTPRVEPVLARIRIQRAFTCFQMLTLLNETLPADSPTLVLDMLSTFHDESVSVAERRRLLGECALRLRFLSTAAPVIVSARPPGQQEGSAGLYALLQAACDTHWYPSPPDVAPEPPALPGFELEE